jgi:gas vesicle protein
MMTDKLEPKASSLMPSGESFMWPSVVTPEERRQMQLEVDRVIKEIGIARQLRESTEANLKEFRSTLMAMLEKVRNDLQPAYIDLVSDLTRTTESNHLEFLGDVESDFRELVTEIQGLHGELAAWEKLKEHQERLDGEHQERLRRLREDTENTARELLESIRHIQIDSDPDRTALVNKVQALAEENGKLKKALANAYRQAQGIGHLGLGKKKRELLTTLGGHIFNV